MHRPHLPGPESAGICAPQVPMSTEWLYPEGSEFHKSLKEARETRRLGQGMRGQASRRGQGQWHRGNSNAFLGRDHWKQGGSYSNRRPWTTELDHELSALDPGQEGCRSPRGQQSQTLGMPAYPSGHENRLSDMENYIPALKVYLRAKHEGFQAGQIKTKLNN